MEKRRKKKRMKKKRRKAPLSSAAALPRSLYRVTRPTSSCGSRLR
jgi:hypothetical protein